VSPILPGRPSSAESSLARLVSIARAAGLLSIARALSVFVVLLLGLAGARKAPASQIPTGFTDSLLVVSLDNPVALAFLPDGRLMWAELKTARIRLMAGRQLAGPIAVIDSVQGAGQEQGLLGIAIDPRWPTSPYVYLFYDALGNFIRISRLTASGDLSSPASTNLVLDPASRRDLIRDIPDVHDNHNGGTLRFGTDGMLYAGLAEDATSCTAQDTVSLRGVMLRMNIAGLPAGPGAPNKALLVPPDNPFAGHSNVNARLVWALGLRNPFRWSIDPATGSIFIGDVGFNTYEEVDIADAPGLDFGWPFYEGPLLYSPCGTPVPPNLRAPIYYYDRTGFMQGGAASVIGGPVYHAVSCPSCNFPGEYAGDYFLSDFYEGFLRRLKRSGGTWALAPAVPGQPSATDWGQGFREVADYAVGPDGALWYARLSVNFQPLSGQIHRIFYSPPLAVPLRSEDAVRFGAPYPSPTRGSVRLSYVLPQAARVELGIFDLGGRRVAVVERNRRVEPGRYSVDWSGKDDEGHEAPPGVYLARLGVDRLDLVRRFAVVR